MKMSIISVAPANPADLAKIQAVMKKYGLKKSAKTTKMMQ